MRIISRYILKFFFQVFSLALCTFVGLYLVIDFFEKVDDILQKQVPVWEAASYFLLKTPFIVTQGIPMAVLLGALIIVGVLNKNREIIALKAAGLSALTYAGPILMAALSIAFLDFFFTENLALSMNQKAQQIWTQNIEHRPGTIGWKQQSVWYHGHNSVYQVRLYDQKSHTLEKVTLFSFDSHFKLLQRMDAKRLRWENGRWIAEQGLIIRFLDGNAEQEWFNEKEMDLPEVPQDFAGLEAIPEELGWADLYGYAQKIRQEGFNSGPYEVELHRRIAFPLTAFVLALFGITIALKQGLHGGILLGVGISLIIAFAYMAVLQLGCSLAVAGILPPSIGVWAGNLIFAALAAFLWTKHVDA